MADTTPNFEFPYPEEGDPFLPSADIQALAESADSYLAGRLINGRSTRFTSSGTFTPTSDTQDWDHLQGLWFYGKGGGGGGGGAATTGGGQAAVGGGGGEGQTILRYVPKSSLTGASITITVGTGGDGNSGAAGSNGSATSATSGGVSDTFAQRGSGGGTSGATPGVGHGVGGAGGFSLSSSRLDFAGGEGSNGIISAGILGSIGHGGGGVRPPTSDSGGDGRNAPPTSGLGGSGGFNYASQGTARSGGNGGSGIMYVIEVY